MIFFRGGGVFFFFRPFLVKRLFHSYFLEIWLSNAKGKDRNTDTVEKLKLRPT